MVKTLTFANLHMLRLFKDYLSLIVSGPECNRDAVGGEISKSEACRHWWIQLGGSKHEQRKEKKRWSGARHGPVGDDDAAT